MDILCCEALSSVVAYLITSLAFTWSKEHLTQRKVTQNVFSWLVREGLPEEMTLKGNRGSFKGKVKGKVPRRGRELDVLKTRKETSEIKAK